MEMFKKLQQFQRIDLHLRVNFHDKFEGKYIQKIARIFEKRVQRFIMLSLKPI